MVSRAARLISCAIGLVAIVTCVLSVCMTSGEPGYAQVGGSPTVADGAACKKALAGLAAGDLSALKSLPPETQTALVQGQTAWDVFRCLAVAEDSTGYCDVLPKEMIGKCVKHYNLVRDMKTLPNESLKAQIMYHICLSSGITPTDCGRLREAITSRNAALCSGLPKPWETQTCPALATGDAKACEGASEPVRRDTCAALATDDPDRCPQGATDCVNMVRDFVLMKQGGLGAARDPSVAAARKGREACAPLLTKLESSCGTVSAPPAPPAGSTPGSSP